MFSGGGDGHSHYQQQQGYNAYGPPLHKVDIINNSQVVVDIINNNNNLCMYNNNHVLEVMILV